MAIEVAPLTEADIPGAVEVIQLAFADDPYFKWVFDESRVRAELDSVCVHYAVWPEIVWSRFSEVA